MCGIAGVVDFAAALRLTREVEAAVASIAHRGPDSRNVWCDGPVALGHARLSIIDLSSAADQPMIGCDGQVAVVFNGEIYNYRELRAELVARGHTFRTSSDTEVLLEAYLHWGDQAFHRLNGMYAFAIWDGRTRQLTLVRDPLGIKPLFWVHTGTRLEFGSEIKAILAMHPDARWQIDPQALHEYLWFGNALGSGTMFGGIRRLEAGECLTFDHAGVRRRRLWCIADAPEVRDDFGTATRRVRDLLEAAVSSHLVSDVPVGIMLSGGIDSSAIATFAARASVSRLSTYSVAFDFEDAGELPAAAKLARQLGTEHHELFVKAEEIATLVTTLVRCHDEPFADAANIPLYLATRQLGASVKVLLQGDGGDEMFAGYRRYQLLGLRAPWRTLRTMSTAVIPRGLDLPVAVRRVLRMWEALGAPDPLRMALLLTMDSERHLPGQILGADMRQRMQGVDPFRRYSDVLQALPPVTDDVQRMLWTDASILLPDTFLDKVDRSTMANSVEVRVPFLDIELAKYALRLPAEYKVQGRQRKRVLRQALRGIVPDEVLDRPKRGFGVPYGRWLRKNLHEFMQTYARESRAVSDGLLDGRRVAQLAEEHRRGRRDHGFLLWKALQLAIWYQDYPVNA
jgi:asparagine synthase (glutamine-hydrolysing)